MPGPDLAAAPGGGYWLFASDGGVFAYGDARFLGSAGHIQLNKPVIGLTPSLDGGGYRLLSRDGGVFAYGDASFYGSLPSTPEAGAAAGLEVKPHRFGVYIGHHNVHVAFPPPAVDLRGPQIHGAPGRRFVYITWG